MVSDLSRAAVDTEPVDLTGVPETMLWPLWNRAAETRRQDRLIEDPMAADLVGRLNYDFAGRFGRPSVVHAIRARVCDDLIRGYLQRSEKDLVVVALGDGLETQLWRLGDTSARWLSVDLPEAIALRRRLLPAHPRAAMFEGSALDPAWMDAVPKGAAPFISAAGLLMYFEEADVAALLSRIAERFPGAEVFFDAIPPFFSRKTLRGFKVTRSYTAPPMPWGIRIDDLPVFLGSLPGIGPVTIQSYADPFPQRTGVYRLLSHITFLRRRLAGSLVHFRVCQ